MKGTHNILITLVILLSGYPLKQMNYNTPPCGLLKRLFTNLKGIVLGLLSYIFLINHV